jgi:outer membrane lipoprotein-sorting protein
MPHTLFVPSTSRRALLGALAALTVGTASAQELSADEVLANLEARTQALQDASFLLTGTIFDTDGQEILLEVEADFIPDEELLRAYFIQPDALADNFVILDGDTVYNYLFVTNQVTILNANDPDALGGLLPEVEEELEGSVNLTPDLGRFFGSDSWEASVEGYEESPDGPVYRLRFDNLDEGANVAYVTATILDGEWLPQSLVIVQANGSPLAELFFEDYLLDSGLDPEELRFIPPDAERIDER